MKRLTLILILLRLTTFAQTEIYINILTFDDKGNRLPNCDLELHFPNDTSTIKLKSDNNGSVTTFVKNRTATLLTGHSEDYYPEKIKLVSLETLLPNDTVFTSLTFKPLLTILHGFTEINFDTTYAIGEIVNFPDTIIIFTTQDQLNPKQNYTKLEKLKSGNYQLLYWEMERVTIIHPTLYNYDLKAKLKKNDEVEMTFGNKKKTYFIRGLKSKNGLYYEMTKK